MSDANVPPTSPEVKIMTLQKTILAEPTADYPAHHSATLTELEDGRIMAVWMRFIKSPLAGNDHAPNQLVSAYSGDGGLTWNEPRLLVEPEAGDVNVYNPSILRLPSGEILFFYYRHLQLAWEKPFSTAAYLRRSTDNGLTFGPTEEVWHDQPYSVACNRLIRLRSGRLLMPNGETLIWGGPKDNQKTTCLFSDDDGRHWRRSEARITLPLRGALEAQAAEAGDGTLVISLRTQLGSPFITRSDDQGETWTKPQTSGLKSPESATAMAGMPDGRLLLVWNHSDFDPAFDHLGRRSPLSWAVSSDAGRSWSYRGDLETDRNTEFSNPSILFLNSGKVLITYHQSPMENPEPPGRLGRSKITLAGSILPVSDL